MSTKPIDQMTPEEIASLDVRVNPDEPHAADAPAMITGDGVLGDTVPDGAITRTRPRTKKPEDPS